MRKYPEHDKLAAAIEPYQADPVATITEFLQWLEDEQGIALMTLDDDLNLTASMVPADCWPLLFFGVAPVDYDEESRAMREEAPDGC